MAKEMIVSVNGREKKIAILEDGKVTEFYIERGEENTGVVGNIYKGRVMRVLPGMQSAFVEVGLERDAFLYVSDFFDEEEEFERIVTEKTQKADVASAEKAASERLRQARLEREQVMEAAQERAEPMIEAKTIETKTIETKKSMLPPQRIASPKILIIEEIEETPAFSAVEPQKIDDSGFSEPRAAEFAPVVQQTIKFEEPEPQMLLLASDDSSFERIVDDETEGDLFKDARIQERLTDQVRAIEFEIEPTPSVEVGTLILDAAPNSNFERIADDDEPETVLPIGKADKKSAEKTGQRDARNRRGGKPKVEPAQSAEQSEDASGSTPESIAAAELQSRKKQRGGRRSNATKDVAPETTGGSKPARGTRAAQQNQAESSVEQTSGESVESPSKNKRGGRSIETTQNTETDSEVAVQSEPGDLLNETSVSDAMTQGYADADASVDDLGAFREEMAVRRGGRRRRGGAATAGRRPDENQVDGEENLNAMDVEESAEAENVENIETDQEPKPEVAPEVSARRVNPGRGSNPPNRERGEQRNEPRNNDRNERPERAERPERPERQDQRGERTEQRTERPERNERSERGAERPERPERSERPERTNDRNDRNNRDRRPPTITDLLREGQEILVQIAKEPIAKKGARITSHIALPGRFLVYMPTIEHAGVSRKIESSTERARLRTLIQKIRAEEDVPSGGFIVRTAGIGISEQDLRDDARYLIRTWLDIRKQSEKAKSPALVHQDLDLVERILRDQLSDDFAAIRVDDESEYLRVVEFINRIQPRMTNRVKLYTRDLPILEAYNVQEEIDKAIKPRVWLKSGGYLVINQTEALVSIDVNTGKFVGGRGGSNRLEDTITKTNMEAVDEIARQVRLRDLGGIIVMDLIDMDDRRNRQKVLQALQEALQGDKSPTKVLSFNDFGLIVMTRKRVKQSLERTLCAPCHYCDGAGLIKSPQTIAYEILSEARRLAKHNLEDGINHTTLRVHPEVAKALRSTERDVLTEIEDYLGAVDLTAVASVHQEQFDFAFV